MIGVAWLCIIVIVIAWRAWREINNDTDRTAHQVRDRYYQAGNPTRHF